MIVNKLRNHWLYYICYYLIGINFVNLWATDYVWNGTGSQNELNNSLYWTPLGVPTGFDTASFDSSITNINTSPIATGADFNSNTLNFPNQANVFNLTFDNLTLSIDGITGTNTNANIFINNTDNLTSINNLVFMSGSPTQIGNASLQISNISTLNGSLTGSSSNVIGDYILSVNGPIVLGNNSKLLINNIGTDATDNGGDNSISEFGYGFISFGDTVSIGNNVLFSITNNALSTATGQTQRSEICSGTEYGIDLDSSFTAEDNLTFLASNIGNDHSTGVGGNETGYIPDVFLYLNETTVGNNASFTITNTGNSTGTTSSSGNSVGYISSREMYISDNFTALDNLSIHLSNEGTDSSSGNGNNRTAYVGSEQIRTQNVTLSNNATFILENSGTYTGNTSSSNDLAYIGNSQARFGGNFDVGNDLTISISNYAEDYGSGSNGNTVGYVSGCQLRFSGSDVTIGNNGNITLSNTGISTTSSIDSVAFISDAQFKSNSPFSSGENLSVSATNNATISGNSTDVGTTTNQLIFLNTCTLGNGSSLVASNLGQGTVTDSQIVFQNGFSIPTGSITIKAINEGTVTNHGIEVQAGTGGNANIILQNNSLNISSSETDFTIASLTGNSSSTVTSQPTLIINTSSSTNATFSGVIEDYSAPSLLTKSGSGTQKLSGLNTMTGLTIVEDGTLILTGSLGGEARVDANGILKGTGTIAQNVSNFGTISPGESIGTIHFSNNFTTTGGFYDVEVSGTGASDLIEVTGDATINGGTILVSSVDGTYKFQDRYTIVSTGGTRSGFYTGANSRSLIQPVVTYDDQHVYLTLLTNIANAAQTSNETNVSNQLDGIVGPTSQQNLLLSELVDLPNNQTRTSLNSLSGYQHNSDRLVSMMVNRQFLRTLFDPIRPIVTQEPDACKNCCANLFTPWIDLEGVFMSINGAQSSGLSGKGYNITIGGQTTIKNRLTIGVAGAYEEDFLTFQNNRGNEIYRNWLAGVYALYRPNNFYGFVDFVFDYSNNYLKRNIKSGNLDYTAMSHPNVKQYTFYGELGGDINFYNMMLQPFFGVEVGSFHRNSIYESYTNGWGLNIQNQSYTFTTPRLGVHFTAHDLIRSSTNLSIDLAWDYYTSTTSNQNIFQFEQFGSSFPISWTKFNRNSFDYSVTLSSLLYKCLEGYFKINGEYWSDANIVDVVVGFDYRW